MNRPHNPAIPSRAAAAGGLAAFALLAWGACIVPARAEEPAGAAPQEEPRWQLMIGAGALYQPDYEGSDDYEISPLPVIMASYDDMVFLRGTTLSANLLTILGRSESDRLEIGPLVNYRFGRDEDDNRALAGLGDVDGALETGLFASYQREDWSVGLSALHDVSGAHDGLIVELEADYGFDLAPQLRLTAGTSVSYASSDYMDAFFSVGPGATSGLPAFEADGGVKGAGLSLQLDYGLSERWMLSGQVKYERLLGDAADSPLVDQAGSPDQVSTGLFLGYRF